MERNDLISRKALLNEMDNWICDFPEWQSNSGYKRGFERAMTIVEAVPPAELPKEPKRGLLAKIFGGKKCGS